MNYMIKMGEGGTVRLPNEYQEVEWIKGRINTGEELEPKGIEEVYEIVQYMEGYENGIFFSNDKNPLYSRLSLRYLNNDYKMWFYFGGNNNTSASYDPLINKKIKIRFTKQAVSANGTMSANCKYYDEDGSLLGTNSTYVPKANVDNWYNTFSDGLPKITLGEGYKTYSFKKVDGKELIPCYRKSDTSIGMYDITNNVFIEATGTTAKGNNVVAYQSIPVGVLKHKKTPNLLKLARTEWNSTSYQPTSLVPFDYDKLYYMASSGYIRPKDNSLNETITESSITFTQTSSSWWGIGFPFEVKPNTKYTISAKRDDGNKTKIMYALYDADGSFKSYAQLTTNTSILDISLTITTGANTKTMVIVVAGITQGTTVYAYDLQVEEGQTRTDFKPYGYEIGITYNGIKTYNE